MNNDLHSVQDPDLISHKAPYQDYQPRMTVHYKKAVKPARSNKSITRVTVD